MLALVTTILFVWLFAAAVGLLLKIAWSAAKVLAVFLLLSAVPVMLGCLLFAGGIAVLIPVGMLLLAAGLLKACI